MGSRFRCPVGIELPNHVQVSLTQLRKNELHPKLLDMSHDSGKLPDQVIPVNAHIRETPCLYVLLPLYFSFLNHCLHLEPPSFSLETVGVGGTFPPLRTHFRWLEVATSFPGLLSSRHDFL